MAHRHTLVALPMLMQSELNCIVTVVSPSIIDVSMCRLPFINLVVVAVLQCCGSICIAVRNTA